MRRASKRFWLLVSLLALTALGFQSGGQANGLKRVEELTLAGFRPGLDTIQNAERVYRRYFHTSSRSIRQAGPNQTIESQFTWSDFCRKQKLTMTAKDEVIRSIAVGSLTGSVESDCEINDTPNAWATGNGLSLGAPCGSVAATYGKPESDSTSSSEIVTLESYLYRFDVARTYAPETMEVSCDTSTQKVVEIKLTASSLHGIS